MSELPKLKCCGEEYDGSKAHLVCPFFYLEKIQKLEEENKVRMARCLELFRSLKICVECECRRHEVMANEGISLCEKAVSETQEKK